MSPLPANASSDNQGAAKVSGGAVNFDVATADHRGGRDEQQDRVAVRQSAAAALLVIADGLGGHRGGALAAQAVLDTAADAWQKVDRGGAAAGEFLNGLRDQAHARILEIGREQGLQPMTTCNLLLIENTEATWVYVGDSRLYRFRDGELIARTRDHSMAEALVELGEMDEAGMADSAEQTQLLSVLGGAEAPEAAGGDAAVAVGDGYILCTDGLWETITVAEMAAALAAPSLDDAARNLVNMAVDRGGPGGDNVAIAMARIAAPSVHPGRQMMRHAARAWDLFSAPVRLVERWVGGLYKKPTPDTGQPIDGNLPATKAKKKDRIKRERRP